MLEPSKAASYIYTSQKQMFMLEKNPKHQDVCECLYKSGSLEDYSSSELEKNKMYLLAKEESRKTQLSA